MVKYHLDGRRVTDNLGTETRWPEACWSMAMSILSICSMACMARLDFSGSSLPKSSPRAAGMTNW